MTRKEHLDWAKKRALEYVDRGDHPGAFSSFLSDMQKHEETSDMMGNPAIETLAMRIMHHALRGDNTALRTEIRPYIEGFN